MRLWIALAATVAMTAGCIGNVNEDNYAQKFSPQYCSKAKTCARGMFDSEWTDVNDCIEEVTDEREDWIDDMDDAGCDFERENAKECLIDIADADCEDFYDGDAFDDCGNNKLWDC